MTRRHLTLTLVACAAIFVLTYFKYTSSHGATAGFTKNAPTPMAAVDFGGLGDVLSGGSIMPKLGNETLRAELGHATWKFLHTMMARYPDEPTEEDQLSLKTFITLFSRLYPCGECAEHFRQLLAKYPPQVSSRNAAAGWLCFAHNIVNKRLKKPEFDCTKIGDFYDCGCADDPGKPKAGKAKPEDGKAKPEDGKAKPEDGKAKPEDGKAKPEDGKAKPEDGKAKPEDGKAKPEDSKAKPKVEGELKE